MNSSGVERVELDEVAEEGLVEEDLELRSEVFDTNFSFVESFLRSFILLSLFS